MQEIERHLGNHTAIWRSDHIEHEWRERQAKTGLDYPFDCNEIWSIWDLQQKHIVCFQDVPGVQLYIKTREAVKELGISLPIYRCG